MKTDKVTIHTLREKKRAGDKIAMLTCYDASFARLVDQAGVDILLVGDSLGMVIQGTHDAAGHARGDDLSLSRGRSRRAPGRRSSATCRSCRYQASLEEAMR